MIEFHRKNGTVLIDDKDAHIVEGKYVTVHKKLSGRRTYLAVILQTPPPNRTPATPLSRAIMMPPPGMVVDHIDGDTLDNRRANLRVCTQSQNIAASRPRLGANEWGYKGIVIRKRTYTGKRGQTVHYYWVVSVGTKGAYLQTHAKSPHNAALLYNKKAKEIYGDFAYRNEVPCFSDDPRPASRCATCNATCDCCCVCK